MRDAPRQRDLRARMERVASKPAVRRPARPRAAPPLPGRALGGQAEVPATAPPAGRSRVMTALLWAQWELAEVPWQRWRWLVAVARGGAVPRSRERY